MSLFSSPAFRVFNSENSESTVQRKPGTNSLLPRKPFVDKKVNSQTPEVNRQQKSSLAIKQPVKAASPTVKTPNLEIDPEHYFSYKKVEDQFEDLLPHSKRLETQDVYNILKNYLDSTTPPPSPTPLDMSFKEPQAFNSLDSSFNSDFSYDEDIYFALPQKKDFMLEPVDEIDVPVFDIDDL